MQHIRSNERHKNIQFEMSIRPTDCYSDMIAHNLGADHGQRFALGWIYLPWHYA